MTIKTVLGFGASTMQGVGDTEGGFFKRLSLDFPKVNFVNHGLGGNTTTDMLGRIEAAKTIKADATLILLGCNDLPRTQDKNANKRTTLNQYQRNLKTIFSQLKTNKNIFVSSFIPDLKKVGITQGNFNDYMFTALEVAEDEAYEIWDLYSESVELGSRYWAPDGLHYNAEGHAFLASKIKKYLS